MFALPENPPDVADEHLEAATDDAERLVRSMMHVRWCLITGIVVQIPSTDHEVIHLDNLALGARVNVVLGPRSVYPRGWFAGTMHQ
jgi:hypothetical protein